MKYISKYDSSAINAVKIDEEINVFDNIIEVYYLALCKMKVKLVKLLELW